VVVGAHTVLEDRMLGGGGMVAKLNGTSMVAVWVMVINMDVAVGGGTMGCKLGEIVVGLDGPLMVTGVVVDNNDTAVGGGLGDI